MQELLGAPLGEGTIGRYQRGSLQNELLKKSFLTSQIDRYKRASLHTFVLRNRIFDHPDQQTLKRISAKTVQK